MRKRQAGIKSRGKQLRSIRIDRYYLYIFAARYYPVCAYDPCNFAYHHYFRAAGKFIERRCRRNHKRRWVACLVASRGLDMPIIYSPQVDGVAHNREGKDGDGCGQQRLSRQELFGVE